jgi:hypothetical protein
MKKEIELLDRAVLNVMSAHERKIEAYHGIMRETMSAVQKLIGGMRDFATGHYVLYDDLNMKARDALASLDEGLNGLGASPPPLHVQADPPDYDEAESFINQLAQVRQSPANGGHYPQ